LSLPSSVNVNIEALSSAGSSANLHFDLVPAEKLLNKAILLLLTRWDYSLKISGHPWHAPLHNMPEMMYHLKEAIALQGQQKASS